ncbi:MAG: cellulose biosynthesis cyclic di-GMP-binding regulatory protein BcsB [Gloeomargarita sp. HHBFW_bins_162]
MRRSLGLIGLTSLWVVGGMLPVLSQPVRTVQKIPFRNLGFTRPVVLRGPSPEFGVSIPIFGRNLDTAQSFVQLELAPSPVLKPSSTVRILLNGRPERVIQVKDLLPEKSIKIPLRLPPPGERFITVGIESFLQITPDFCEDVASGNLFLTVGDNSFFQLVKTETDTPINYWFRPTYNQVVVVVPQQMDTPTAQAALWMYSLLNYRFRESRVPIIWFAGDLASLKLDPNTDAAVVLHQDEQVPNIQRQGNILRVRAQPDVVESLAEAQPAFMAPAVQVEETDPAAPRRLRDRRLFSELGWPEDAKTGLGNQSFRLTFDLAQLGGRPQDLSLALRSRFSQASRDDSGALSAQIFLNGTFINSFNVGTQTQLNTTLALPEQRLERTNNLDVVFQVAQRDCRSPRPVTVQVLGSSYLDWNGFQRPLGTFEDVPQEFLGKGQVVVDIANPAVVAGTAQVLGMLSRSGRRPLLPELLPVAEVRNWNNLPQRPAWRLLGTAPGVRLNSPIRLGQSFEIINPINQNILLKTQPGASIGVLQAFFHQGVPTLWLSWWGNQPQVAQQTGAVLADPVASLVNQLQGNVVTVTPQGSFDYWNLTSDTLQVRYPDELNWWLLLRRYRWVLLGLFLVIGGILAWRLYQRLGRRAEAPTPPAP